MQIQYTVINNNFQGPILLSWKYTCLPFDKLIVKKFHLWSWKPGTSYRIYLVTPKSWIASAQNRRELRQFLHLLVLLSWINWACVQRLLCCGTGKARKLYDLHSIWHFQHLSSCLDPNSKGLLYLTMTFQGFTHLTPETTEFPNLGCLTFWISVQSTNATWQVCKSTDWMCKVCLSLGTLFSSIFFYPK